MGSQDVVVYLHHRSVIPPEVSEALWQESGSVMRLGGYHVRRLEEPHQVQAAFLVVVELEGQCDGADAPAISPPPRSLASTMLENGRILPFVKVDCTALRQFLAPALAPKTDARFLYGRALGRLLAHELYHIAAQTVQHTAAGVTQRALSAGDLISPKLSLGRAAVENLCSREPASETAATEANSTDVP